MSKRNRHPDKHIEAAIVYAESLGWEFRESGGSSHAWGKLFCPLHTRDGHHLSIYTTPSNPFRYAQLICQRINKCEHDSREPTS